MSFDTDEAAAQELKLYTENEGSLHNQQEAIVKNLVTKIAQGKYNHELAVQAFMYFAESGAKKYAKDFGGVWHQMFPVPVRQAAATKWRDEFEALAKDGEFDSLLPKKYQKTTPSKPKSKASRMTSDYIAGQKSAERVAASLTLTEIESILKQHHVYGTSGGAYHPDFKRGYFGRMQAIRDAMLGN